MHDAWKTTMGKLAILTPDTADLFTAPIANSVISSSSSLKRLLLRRGVPSVGLIGAVLLSIPLLSPKSAVGIDATNLSTKLSTNALDPPDKIADSADCIPVPLVLLARGCQGDGGVGCVEQVICPQPKVLIGTMVFFWQEDVPTCTQNNSYKKYGATMMWIWY